MKRRLENGNAVCIQSSDDSNKVKYFSESRNLKLCVLNSLRNLLDIDVPVDLMNSIILDLRITFPPSEKRESIPSNRFGIIDVGMLHSKTLNTICQKYGYQLNTRAFDLEERKYIIFS